MVQRRKVLLLQLRRCAEIDSCDGERSTNRKKKVKIELRHFRMEFPCGLLTGFLGRSDSCRTMDLDWLRRSAELWGLFMRMCTASCDGGRIRVGGFTAFWRLEILGGKKRVLLVNVTLNPAATSWRDAVLHLSFSLLTNSSLSRIERAPATLYQNQCC